MKRFKIDFNVFTSSYQTGTLFGISSIIVEINSLPTGGTCTISPIDGITEVTVFTIRCSNWTDDGFISKYEYYCNRKEKNLLIVLIDD